MTLIFTSDSAHFSKFGRNVAREKPQNCLSADKKNVSKEKSHTVRKMNKQDLFYFCFVNFTLISIALTLLSHGFQITRHPTGFTQSPPEKNVARIQSIKSSNWKRSFCLTCTFPGIVDTR